jgi:hypothetical protein
MKPNFTTMKPTLTLLTALLLAPLAGEVAGWTRSQTQHMQTTSE